MQTRQLRASIDVLEKRFSPIMEPSGRRVLELRTPLYDRRRPDRLSDRIYVPTDPKESLPGSARSAGAESFRDFFQLPSGLVVHRNLVRDARLPARPYVPRPVTIVTPSKRTIARYFYRWTGPGGMYHSR